MFTSPAYIIILLYFSEKVKAFFNNYAKKSSYSVSNG